MHCVFKEHNLLKTIYIVDSRLADTLLKMALKQVTFSCSLRMLKYLFEVCRPGASFLKCCYCLNVSLCECLKFGSDQMASLGHRR